MHINTSIHPDIKVHIFLCVSKEDSHAQHNPGDAHVIVVIFPKRSGAVLALWEDTARQAKSSWGLHQSRRADRSFSRQPWFETRCQMDPDGMTAMHWRMQGFLCPGHGSFAGSSCCHGGGGYVGDKMLRKRWKTAWTWEAFANFIVLPFCSVYFINRKCWVTAAKASLNLSCCGCFLRYQLCRSSISSWMAFSKLCSKLPQSLVPLKGLQHIVCLLTSTATPLDIFFSVYIYIYIYLIYIRILYISVQLFLIWWFLPCSQARRDKAVASPACAAECLAGAPAHFTLISTTCCKAQDWIHIFDFSVAKLICA